MKLPAYPRTKPSGVEWLGDVPEHWGVKRGRFAMRVNPPAPRLRALKPEDEVSFVPMDAVGVGGGLSLGQTRILSEVSSGYTEFEDGDVVVAKITPCFENGKAALASGLLNGAAYGTTELHVLRAGPTLDRSFLFYVAISDTFQKLGESEMYGAGGQKRVPPEFNKNFRTPLPPLAEQRAIAAFLDRETGRVDRLVAKKRELIERLKEKRTALISRTVTRGLPPAAARAAGLPENPPLKPSALDWLGDIPKHWQVIQLRRLVRTGATITYGIVQAGPDIEDGIPYIRTSDMAGDALPRTGYLRTTPEIDASYSRSKVRPNDLVVAIRASLGKGLLVPDFLDGANLTQGTAKISPGKKLLPRFLFWSFNSEYCQSSISVVAKGTTFLEITLEALRRIPLAVPPLPEQAAIAAYLDAETAKLDALVGKVAEAVERLQEYRTALITAAVTGKIDVRKALAHVP